jgi:hypothetical protein
VTLALNIQKRICCVYLCRTQKRTAKLLLQQIKVKYYHMTQAKHDHEGNEQRAEVKQRVQVQKWSEDVTSHLSKTIRLDLQVHGELTLQR